MHVYLYIYIYMCMYIYTHVELHLYVYILVTQHHSTHKPAQMHACVVSVQLAHPITHPSHELVRRPFVGLIHFPPL